MTLEKIKNYLLVQKSSTLEFPFGEEVMVFKVMNRMFALLSWQKSPLSLNLKCDPDEAIVLREVFEAVIPGYHQNKKHWNTIILDGSIPEKQIFEMVDNSYELVVKGLKKADREKLKDA
ncbi:MAG: MmcQ/YjbR family DNA-binding protein [Calditrichaeota bacterium]|nr:MAG: MmcQ/YjbR family DNA-binding protein [Calditrichota bacterium]